MVKISYEIYYHGYFTPSFSSMRIAKFNKICLFLFIFTFSRSGQDYVRLANYAFMDFHMPNKSLRTCYGPVCFSVAK